ncbi:MAG: hypothetical protein ABI165_13940 [Bryobacteraceae bacterium]
MQVRHNRAAQTILVLLIISGFVFSQAVSQSATHSHEPADHCCVVCHIGHSLLLQPSPSFTLSQPTPLIVWNPRAERKPAAREPLILASASRGPPCPPVLL